MELPQIRQISVIQTNPYDTYKVGNCSTKPRILPTCRPNDWCVKKTDCLLTQNFYSLMCSKPDPSKCPPPGNNEVFIGMVPDPRNPPYRDYPNDSAHYLCQYGSVNPPPPRHWTLIIIFTFFGLLIILVLISLMRGTKKK